MELAGNLNQHGLMMHLLPSEITTESLTSHKNTRCIDVTVKQTTCYSSFHLLRHLLIVINDSSAVAFTVSQQFSEGRKNPVKKTVCQQGL